MMNAISSFKQLSRAHRRPAYKSQVFANRESEAAAEPHRIGEEGEGRWIRT